MFLFDIHAVIKPSDVIERDEESEKVTPTIFLSTQKVSTNNHKSTKLSPNCETADPRKLKSIANTNLL